MASKKPAAPENARRASKAGAAKPGAPARPAPSGKAAAATQAPSRPTPPTAAKPARSAKPAAPAAAKPASRPPARPPVAPASKLAGPAAKTAAAAATPAAKPAPKAAAPAAKPGAKVAPIPTDQPRLTPYLVTKEAGKIVDFLKRVLGGTERCRMATPDGKIMHAEVKIADSLVMLAEANEQFPAMPSMLSVYVEDVDATYAKAVAAGATPLRPVENQFYGDRSGAVKDAGGNQWWFATRIENLSPEEIGTRAAAMGMQCS
jgi:uncharacterized glyoxalase superfamily protein PhnB